MSRILFIVNEHPNEAFAISTAKRTADILRSKGHEVIWHKVKPERTLLGKAIKSPKNPDNPRQKYTHKDADRLLGLSVEEINEIIRQSRADITYNFHCTPTNRVDRDRYGKTFTDTKTRGGIMFMPDLRGENFREDQFASPLRAIEIFVPYKDISKRVTESIRKRVSNYVWGGSPKQPWAGEKDSYLGRTTSNKLARQVGLTPERIAARLAKGISSNLKTLEKSGALSLEVQEQEMPFRRPKKRTNRL